MSNMDNDEIEYEDGLIIGEEPIDPEEYKLLIEKGREIINRNIKKIYHLPKKYTYLNHFIGDDTPLRYTLLSIYQFILKHESMPFRYHKRYCFHAVTSTITTKARKRTKHWGMSTTNKHINFLCAMGLFRKEEQYEETNELTEINKNFLKKNKNKRPENVLSYEEYTNKKLEKCEALAKSLFNNGITAGNISRDKLIENNCKTIAERVFYKNNKKTVIEKRSIYAEIEAIIKQYIESYGYATKQNIYDNCRYSDCIIDTVLGIYKADLQKQYYYKRPTKIQMKEYGLTKPKFIYTRRE